MSDTNSDSGQANAISNGVLALLICNGETFTVSEHGVVTSSPFDSASNISVSTKTNVKSCLILYGDIETQCYLQVPELPPFPDEWKPPSQICARLCFNAICWFSVGKSDLEKFWRAMEGKSWKEYNKLDYSSDLNGSAFLFSIMFGLTMPILSAIQPDHTSIGDHRYYNVLLFMSLLWSFLGLCCDTLRSLFHSLIELREQVENQGQKQFQLSRHEVLVYVVHRRIAFLGPLISSVCLVAMYMYMCVLVFS